MDARLEQVTHEILEHAFLYDDPDSFREGVLQTARALDDLDAATAVDGPGIDRDGPMTCPECMIPFDEEDPDDAHCPWCGARMPEPLQELVWAEMRAMELAWRDAVSV